MAIKCCLIALCLVLGALLVHADPEADADAYYGHHHGYYGHRHHHRGYYGHRYYGGYHRRPYGGYYKPQRYHNRGYWKRPTYSYRVVKPIEHVPAPLPAPIESVPAVPLPAAPIEVKSVPEVKAAPAPAPVVKVEPVHYEEPLLNAFNVVPAVPEEHSVAYSALPMMAAPPLMPQPAEVYEAEPLPQVHQQAPAPANLNNEVVASQYHAQDEFGNVIYGYSNPNSAKTEQRDVYGNVIGSYSYVDGTGLPKHVAYVADDFGFRVTSSNNLPIAVVR